MWIDTADHQIAGAMVDSEVPEYQLSIEETWKTYDDFDPGLF